MRLTASYCLDGVAELFMVPSQEGEVWRQMLTQEPLPADLHPDQISAPQFVNKI